MPLASDIIQDVVEMLGIYSPGETVASADSARLLFILNTVLDELASQNIFVYQLTPITVTMSAAKAQYSIGPGGADATAARPEKIAYGAGAGSVTVSAVTTPLRVVSAIEFQSLLAYAPVPGLPDTLWYNPTYPLGQLNLLPVPANPGTFIVNDWTVLLAFATLATSVTFATGALDALRNILAVAAQPYFRDKATIDSAIIKREAESKDFLRYQSQTSRAMFRRFTLSTAPQKDIANA